MSVPTSDVGFRFDGVMKANNVNFTGIPGSDAAQVTTNGQLLIGSTAAPNIRVGTLTSTGGTVAITPGAGTINLEVAGGVAPLEKLGVQASSAPGTNPVVPTAGNQININGAAVAASGIPVRSDSIAANALQIEVQRSSAQAVSAAANAGLASFSNAQFSVDANGFVTEINGLPAAKFAVQANTAPGTNPVVPTAAGVVTVNGTIVAAHSIPIQTDSLAANAYNVEVQRSAATAATDATSQGMCSFNSAQFTVDANGWVSALSGVAPWLDIAGGALANHTGYFVTAAAAVTLPLGAANGDQVEIVDVVGGGVVVTASGAQKIQVQNQVSSAGGTMTSTQKGDSLRLTFRLADVSWYATPGAGGNWIPA